MDATMVVWRWLNVWAAASAVAGVAAGEAAAVAATRERDRRGRVVKAAQDAGEGRANLTTTEQATA